MLGDLTLSYIPSPSLETTTNFLKLSIAPKNSLRGPCSSTLQPAILVNHSNRCIVVPLQFRQLLIFIFVYLVCIWRRGTHIPQNTHGGQRTTLRSWFSTSTTWFPGWNSGHQAWQQVPLPADLTNPSLLSCFGLVCACMYTCMWRPADSLSSILRSPPSISLRQSLSLAQNSSIRLASQWALKTFFVPPSSGITAMTGVFMWVLGIELRSLGLQGKHYTSWATLPAPLCSFDLPFFDDWWYWAIFHMFVCHSNILCSEMSIASCCLYSSFSCAVFSLSTAIQAIVPWGLAWDLLLASTLRMGPNTGWTDNKCL